MPAHLITSPGRLIIDHIGTEVGIKPRRITAHFLAQHIHGGGIEATRNLVQTGEVVFNPPEPIFARAKIVIGGAGGTGRR